MSRDPKTRERTVYRAIDEYLDDTYPDLELQYDRLMEGSCVKRRGDFVIDCDTHMVVVECDEDMHRTYSCDAERQHELMTAHPGTPFVFIRFNPDAYTDIRGTHHPSCFGRGADGILRVKPSREAEWDDRLFKMVTWLDWAISTPPVDFLETTVWLYYDGYGKGHTPVRRTPIRKLGPV